MKRTMATMAAGLLLASTAAVGHAAPTPAQQLAAGLGCGAQCIETAWVTPAEFSASVDYVRVRATDAQGHTAHRLGTFETLAVPGADLDLEYQVSVTFWKVEVENDAKPVLG